LESDQVNVYELGSLAPATRYHTAMLTPVEPPWLRSDVGNQQVVDRGGARNQEGHRRHTVFIAEDVGVTYVHERRRERARRAQVVGVAGCRLAGHGVEIRVAGSRGGTPVDVVAAGVGIDGRCPRHVDLR
jgi:hypothetical protein